jgi:hypothetical protein
MRTSVENTQTGDFALVAGVAEAYKTSKQTAERGRGGEGKQEGPGPFLNQPPWFKMYPSTTQDLTRRTEITPVKDSHTRIKPLPLASGHGRYITVTPERTRVSVEECPLHITVINF